MEEGGTWFNFREIIQLKYNAIVPPGGVQECSPDKEQTWLRDESKAK